MKRTMEIKGTEMAPLRKGELQALAARRRSLGTWSDSSGAMSIGSQRDTRGLR